LHSAAVGGTAFRWSCPARSAAFRDFALYGFMFLFALNKSTLSQAVPDRREIPPARELLGGDSQLEFSGDDVDASSVFVAVFYDLSFHFYLGVLFTNPQRQQWSSHH